MFLKEMSPGLHSFDPKYRKAVILWNVIAILNNGFLSEYIVKCNLLLWSLLQCHMILQKSCWFATQESFLIIISVENSCAAEYFCGNRDTFYFSGFFDKYSIYI